MCSRCSGSEHYIFPVTSTELSVPCSGLVSAMLTIAGAVLFRCQISFRCAQYREHVNGRMMKVLNVAEKNDAAKSLADIMSNGS